MINFRPWSLNPSGERAPDTHSIGGWVGLRPRATKSGLGPQ